MEAPAASSPSSTMDYIPSKPPSIRSVASNNSVASGVSLTRKPRARPRSRTVTGASSTRAPDSPSALPYLDRQLVDEPLPLPLQSPSGAPQVPPMPPAPVEHQQTASATPTTQNTDLAGAETTYVESPVFGKLPTKASLAPKSSLPAIHTRYQPPPSAFSRDPSHIPNVRDSVSTHQSGASSSLYPLSSSTASGPESPPSPRSMSEQFDHLDAVRIDTEPMSVQEFDSDDVAYRLQLLVKNNYFLPPAHSKPSPSDFAAIAASNPKKQPKTSSPVAFLDLFRAAKPKSKPTTPTGSPHFDAPPPMLRATSDSITAPHAPRTQQIRTSAQMARIPTRPASRGRVVVVREKMVDISVAAKQAEQDLKNKGVRLDKIPPVVNQDIFDDVVDPTDAVDVPLPSASYPFAVQASALHGLGVLDSLGADVLADRLPPSQSPNQSSSFEIDSRWRKALLHQAVERSLDNTPDVSTFSHALGVSTPVNSVRRRSKSAAPAPNPAHRLGGVFEEPLPESSPAVPLPRRAPLRATPSSSLSVPQQPGALDQSVDSRTSSYVPPRVETPSSPLIPLSPNPRRNFLGAHQSSSQTDLSTPQKEAMEPRPHSSASRHTLRRAQSSPVLAECEPLTRRAFEATPPPPLPYSLSSSRIPSARTTMSFDTTREGMETHTMAGSIYSDDEVVYGEDDHGRNSLALSAVMGRPSLSEYSQDSFTPSPTTSAFQDALNHPPGYHSSSSSYRNPSQVSLDRGREGRPRAYTHTRDDTISPPPRMSSSLAHFSALPPPPRPAQQPFPRHFLRPQSIDSTASTEPGSLHGADDDALHFTEPEPTTPPLPTIALSRSSSHGLSLDIPRPSALRSVEAAEPSPTAFFDSFETQHNALDEESSDESEGEEDVVDELAQRTTTNLQRPFSNDPRARTTSTVSAPIPRSPLMKFGNNSVPYVKQPADSLRHVPIGSAGVGHEANFASKQPVGNVVSNLKAPFFSDRKSDSDHASASSPYDFYRFTQGKQPPSGSSLTVSDSRASTGDGRPSFSGTFSSVASSKAQSEEVRKLDGMLLQHMEAEKDTIKRIATTLKQSGPPPSAWDEGRALPAPSQPKQGPAAPLPAREPGVDAASTISDS